MPTTGVSDETRRYRRRHPLFLYILAAIGVFAIFIMFGTLAFLGARVAVKNLPALTQNITQNLASAIRVLAFWEKIGTNEPEAASTPPEKTAKKAEEPPAPRIAPKAPLVQLPGPKKITAYPGGIIRAGGHPDLAISIIQTGLMDKNGDFIATSSVPKGSEAAILFEVRNIGDASSGGWKFFANLPVTEGNFTSEPEASLAPGDRIRFTIGFGELSNAGANGAAITVDPEDLISDSNRANNAASTTLIRAY